MQFAKPFRGVPDGEIYPIEYQPGDECPPELEASAEALGAFENDEASAEAPAKSARAKK